MFSGTLAQRSARAAIEFTDWLFSSRHQAPNPGDQVAIAPVVATLSYFLTGIVDDQ
jgi:hypothetical protein